MSTKEQINHPDHYNSTAIEAINVIEDNGWAEGFCLGNAYKYMARAGKKDGEGLLKDLKKSRWYIDRYVKYLETTESDRRKKIAEEILARAEKEYKELETKAMAAAELGAGIGVTGNRGPTDGPEVSGVRK